MDTRYKTYSWAEYDIRTAIASSASYGEVAFLVRENNKWTFSVKNKKVVGSNVISYKMVTGLHKGWFIAGCYLPPLDKEVLTQRMVIDALENRPKGKCPIVIGNLNSNPDFPWDR